MANEVKDPLEYDDEAAIAFIRNHIPQELKEKFSDDDLYYLLDTIYDYYDQKGYLKDDDDMVEIDLDDMTAYVYKAAKKEGMKIEDDEVAFIVDAEISYCDSLGIFE